MVFLAIVSCALVGVTIVWIVFCALHRLGGRKCDEDFGG